MIRTASAAALAGLLLAGCANPMDDEKWRSRHLFTTEGPVDPMAARLESVGPGKRPLLVQFDGRVRPEWRTAVETAGIEVRGYFPENALLVEATSEQALRLGELPAIRAVVGQKPSWRIDPRLLRMEGSERLDVLVEIGGPGDREAAVAAIAAAGGLLTEEPADWLLRASVPADRIDALAEEPAVRFVEQTPLFEAQNDEARFVLGSADAKSRPVELRGEGQIVGVADSGVDESSCFFEGGKLVAYQGAARDESGHGTHVAASIAGDRFANGVAESYDGMAPAAALYVQDVGSEAGTALDGIPRDLGRLFQPAYDAGVRIHSNSWGSGNSIYGPTARSLDAFVAAHPDFLVLAANGNDGPTAGSVGSPAVAKNLIAVGASGTGDRAAAITDFSSRGPAADGRIKPTLVAPGQEIWSAAAGEACSVTSKSGTSMATPIAAGAAALARQYFTEGYYPTGAASAGDGFAPSAALLRAVLVAGAGALGAEAGEGGVPSNGQGFGRIDLGRALFFAGEADGERLWIAEEGEPVALGEMARFTLEVEEGAALQVALAWTDAPGVSGATRALVDDLDLELVAPDGTSYRGNALEDGASVPGGAWDRENVEEVVRLPAALAGTWELRVRGANVPEGTRPFAVAAIGSIRGASEGGRAEIPPEAPPDRVEQVAREIGDAAGCGAAGGGAVPVAGIAAVLVALRRRRRVAGSATHR